MMLTSSFSGFLHHAVRVQTSSIRLSFRVESSGLQYVVAAYMFRMLIAVKSVRRAVKIPEVRAASWTQRDSKRQRSSEPRMLEVVWYLSVHVRRCPGDGIADIVIVIIVIIIVIEAIIVIHSLS